MEVHPPEHPIHTWRDFLVHMGTIVLGLLIAIGLEQSVEWLHHRHQRHHLEEDMRAECERNLEVTRGDLETADAAIAYLSSTQHALLAASHQGALYTVQAISLPETRGTILLSPSRGTLSVARAAGLVALLPSEEAKVYSRVDFTAEEQLAAEDAMNSDAIEVISNFLKDGMPFGKAGTFQLTAEQRADLIFHTSHFRESWMNYTFRTAILQGGLDAVAHDVHTLEQMYPYEKHAAELHSNFIRSDTSN